MTTQDRALIGGLCGALIATTIEAHRILRKHNKLVEKHNALIDRHAELLNNTNRMAYMLKYLSRMLDENGIEFDEFDMIALNDPPGFFKGEFE